MSINLVALLQALSILVYQLQADRVLQIEKIQGNSALINSTETNATSSSGNDLVNFGMQVRNGLISVFVNASGEAGKKSHLQTTPLKLFQDQNKEVSLKGSWDSIRVRSFAQNNQDIISLRSRLVTSVQNPNNRNNNCTVYLDYTFVNNTGPDVNPADGELSFLVRDFPYSGTIYMESNLNIPKNGPELKQIDEFDIASENDLQLFAVKEPGQAALQNNSQSHVVDNDRVYSAKITIPADNSTAASVLQGLSLNLTAIADSASQARPLYCFAAIMMLVMLI